MPRRNIASESDFGPMVDSNLSANFRSAETAKLSTKRVSAPDPEHPFQTRFRESPLTLGTTVRGRPTSQLIIGYR
ncbi:hypothetical protein E0H43_06900 [Rhizobium leguminosarum bv. viciae]|nr:hypothetical protein E0H43_06900 [Rhizobium leguminosarum bv. viciae]